MLQKLKIKSLFKKYMDAASPLWESFWERKISNDNLNRWEIESYQQYQEMMKGGKHLRACLVILGWKMAGKDPFDPNILKASGSIEILHNAFLIHDDIVDKSLLRRNSKTVHEKFKDELIENKKIKFEEAKDFGISVALNVGDLGQALAQELLMSCDFPAEPLLKAIRLFNEHLQHTVLGQMYDMDIVEFEELSEVYVEKIHEFKTAYYTFVFPLLLGYYLAEGEEGVSDLIKEFGITTGIVYQMRDDYLGVFGEEGLTGKSIDSDITEGKKTLFIVKAWENGSPEDRINIQSIVGNKYATEQDLIVIRDIIKKTKAFEYSNEKTRLFAQKAEVVIGKMNSIDKDSLEILKEVTRYVSERLN